MLKFWKKKDADKDSGAQADVASGNPPPVPEVAQPQTAGAAAPDGKAPAAVTPDTAEEAIADTPVAEASATGEARGRWRSRLAGSGFARGLSSLFARNPKLDDTLLDELETTLITADVGVATSMELVESLRARAHKREFADSQALVEALRGELLARIRHVEQPLDVDMHRPFVLLVVGVNGVGKTTTIGKLAHRYRQQGLAVTLAAGDTFRAAAVEQLQAWGQRNGVPVIAQGQGADSASVIYDALDAARAHGSDILIADTAGRLHTQSGLMDELAKVIRVMGKIDPQAPHEVLMVIDGNTGQNAISQLRQFHSSAGVTGLVVTKLDGTAKGGVVFALAQEFKLPIRFVGLGEGIDDLRPFDARAFVDGLLPDMTPATGAGNGALPRD